MLKTFMESIPFTKLITVQDTFQNPAGAFLMYFLKLHSCPIHYLIFEGNFQVIKQQSVQQQHVTYYDFTSDPLGWLGNKPELLGTLDRICSRTSVVIIDSLVHVVYLYGLRAAYDLLGKLKSNKRVLRAIAVFHQDLIRNNDDIANYFQHLSTVSIVLMPLKDVASSLTYVYKKSGGKVVKKMENYDFVYNTLNCTPIQKVTVQHTPKQPPTPLNLATFNLSLTDKEKEARSRVILPYLAKRNEIHLKGEIEYTFDEVDDWDEEDPDDDLDI